MQEMTKDEQIAVMQAKMMAKNKEWYNRPWYKKLAWRVKLMFS